MREPRVEQTAQAATEAYDVAGSYDARLELLHRLMTDHPLPEGILDPRDGIILQTAWQANTRGGSAGPDLLTATTAGGKRVLYGWWANVNFTLSAWQMEALKIVRGEYADAKLIGYAGLGDPCLDVARLDARTAAARPIVDAIAEFYDVVDLTMSRAKKGLLGTDAERSAAEAELQTKMWRFHSAAAVFALEHNEDFAGEAPRPAECERLGTVLPPGERSFATAWGKSLVPLLAALNFSTSEALVGPINKYVMPQSVVTEADLDLFHGKSSMPVSERAGVSFIVGIDAIESNHGEPIRRVLEQASSIEGFGERSMRLQSELVRLIEATSPLVNEGHGEGEGCRVDADCAPGLHCRPTWGFLATCAK